MSLSRMLAGRKKDSPVWEFYVYDETSGKSTCTVENKATKGVCGTTLAGQNSSNSIAHLKRIQKETNKLYLSLSKKKTEIACGTKRKADGTPVILKAQTLVECIQRRVVSWPKESREHQQR